MYNLPVYLCFSDSSLLEIGTVPAYAGDRGIYYDKDTTFTYTASQELELYLQDVHVELPESLHEFGMYSQSVWDNSPPIILYSRDSFTVHFTKSKPLLEFKGVCDK